MRLALFGLVLATAAHAQALAVSVMDAPGLSDEKVRRAHQALVEQLKALTALPVEGSLDSRGPKKSCAEADTGCQRERVQAAGAAAVLAVWLNPTGFDAALWVDGEKVSGPGSTLEAVLPQWVRRGWGGLNLSEEPAPGSALKLDGKVVPHRPGEVLAVTAGPHQLDVLFPDGRALLQRVDVPEGSRTRVELAAPLGAAPPTSSSASGISAVRVTSYVAWMLGTATLLSAFIVAFVGRQTASGASPCAFDSRECLTYAQAAEQQRAAQGYASIANVLLGAGLVVSLAGAGFFTFDVLR